MPHVDLRFEITPDTVDERTVETFIANFVIQKFEFIELVVPLENNGFGHILPKSERAVKRLQGGEAS